MVKEKYDIIDSYVSLNEYPAYYHSSKIELMMEDYAEQQTVAFANWINNHPLDFKSDGNGLWIGLDFVGYTTDDLYKLFLNDKVR